MRRLLKESHFKSVYLIGFSGSGKSTIGPMLARELKAEFFDTDAMIEKKRRKSIDRIFRSEGERAFRNYETDFINRLVQESNREKVVALGGGAFELGRNRRIIADDGLIIYLSCPIRILYQRLKGTADRPLLVGQVASRSELLGRIKRIVSSRKQNYEKADVRISTAHQTAQENARRILIVIKKLNANS